MRDNYDYLKNILPETTPRTLDSGLGDFSKWSDYYRVHYLRAEMMFYALFELIGEDAFAAFIKEYYQSSAFKIAQPENLIKAAEKISGNDLKDFFNSWIYNGNMPLLPNGG